MVDEKLFESELVYRWRDKGKAAAETRSFDFDKTATVTAFQGLRLVCAWL